jgi:thiol:disulfide interchange protein DsbD
MRFHVIALLLLFTRPVISQIVQPVHWTFEATPVEGDEYDLVATAKLEKGWNIYSQFFISPRKLSERQSEKTSRAGKTSRGEKHGNSHK